MRIQNNDECSELLVRWKRQFGDRPSQETQRPFRLAALGYLTSVPARHGLIELKHLQLVVFRGDRPDTGLSLVGFSAALVDWGVAWGSPARNQFDKDLCLEPRLGARGRRLDLARRELVELGLTFEREVRRHTRFRRFPIRRSVKLPRLWAGFRPADADGLEGDGPEFEAACRLARRPAARLLAQSCRRRFGLALYPLDWVSHRWQAFAQTYADLSRFPRCQVFRVRDGQLAGYRGAAQFDLDQSRFARRQPAESAACA
jgi:hypothetical protein